jgi:hypothetical protein
MTLLELAYQRRKAKTQAAGLLKKAMDESRSLSIPEQVCFDSLAARIATLDRSIAERESLRKMVK